MAPPKEFPKPKYATGGCLCEALRYRIDFPDNHDFEASSWTCQCTQCRKNTGSLFFASHHVANAAFRWTSPNTGSHLRRFHTTPVAERGSCGTCGSFLYWRRVSPQVGDIYVSVGSIDPLFLFGEGADGEEVPKGGFGVALVSGRGGHVWCGNEIPGVTDQHVMGLLHGRGTRYPGH
ncbi:Mss4-like protein [Xylaria arbuscula]|nr:Mss4-like protein [Xylaria arbuscula]